MATNVSATGSAILPYEESLRANREWAMSEGSGFFSKASQVHKTIERLASRLNELGIPYALCGGMAVFYHGYQRFTDDVDVLVTPEGLKRIHEELDGRGYLRPFEKSKNLRDTTTGVRIEFLVAGQFPGDGKPKEVAFPAPEIVKADIDGVWVLDLPTLITLKITSGITGAGRQKDLGDVVALIQSLGLPREFEGRLAPSVRDKFGELWKEATAAQGRFLLIYSLDEQAEHEDAWEALQRLLPDQADKIRAMQTDQVAASFEVRGGNRVIVLASESSAVAKKYDMHPENEYE